MKIHTITGFSIITQAVTFIVMMGISVSLYGSAGLDGTPFLLLWIGLSLSEGRQTTYVWGVFLLVFFGGFALLGSISMLFDWPYFMDTGLALHYRKISCIFMLVMTLWSSVNVWGLLRSLRYYRMRFWTKSVSLVAILLVSIGIMFWLPGYIMMPQYATRKFFEHTYSQQIDALTQVVQELQEPCLFLSQQPELAEVFLNTPEVLSADIQNKGVTHAVVSSNVELLYLWSNKVGKVRKPGGEEVKVIKHHTYVKNRNNEWVTISLLIEVRKNG